MSPLPPALTGVYDGRPIDLGKLPVLLETAVQRPRRPAELSRDLATLYDVECQERAKKYQLLREDRDVLRTAARECEAGEIQTFRFQGRRHDAADAERLLKKIDRLLEEEKQWWTEFDRKVFLVHYAMARDLGADETEELRSRYEFHLALQGIDHQVSRRRRVLAQIASFIDDGPEQMHYDDFAEVRRRLLEAYDAFDRCLRTACGLKPPPLECLPEEQPLGNVLLSRPLVRRLRPTARVLPGRWLDTFQTQLDEARQNLRPVLSESLTALLTLQMDVAGRWLEEMASLPEVEEAEAEGPYASKEAPREEDDLQPLDGEPEFELSEQDVLAASKAAAEAEDAALEEPEEEPEFELSEQDVLAEPEEAGPGVELEDLDPDDHTKRPRHWNV